MADYTVNYSNSIKNINGPSNNVGVVIPSGGNAPVSSINLIGQNYPLYAQTIDQNFLYLLENFAYSSPPANPAEGQLWYDSGSFTLKVRTYSNGWIPANGVYEMDTDPTQTTPANLVQPGFIWADTANNILKMWNGSEWIQVGPTGTSGAKTGSYPTVVTDSSGNTHNVVITYIDDLAIEIAAKEAFTPTPIIDGFTNLVPGINISSKQFTTKPIFNGVANIATQLQQVNANGTIQTVPGSSFIRNDVSHPSVNGTFIVNNDNGILIGLNTSTVSIQKSGNRAIFSNVSAGSQFVFRGWNINSDLKTGLLIDFSQQVGSNPNLNPRVGINNLNPAVELDVSGSANINNQVTVNYTPNSQLASDKANKLIVGGNSHITGNLQLDGSISVANSATFAGTITVYSNIVPGPNANISIGSSATAFSSIAAQTIFAKSIGGIGGSTATLYGSASQLLNPQKFSLTGPIQSVDSAIFNGTSPVGLVTTITNRLITDAPSYPINFDTGLQKVPDVTDEILVYSTVVSTSPQIYSVSKEKFLQDVYTNIFMTGMIIPYAGTELPPNDPNTNLPTWLWCDGSAQLKTTAPNLSNMIAGVYGPFDGVNFYLPNLNGNVVRGGENTLYTNTSTSPPALPIGIPYIIKT